MKNLLKLILIIVLFFSVNSCGIHWQYSTLNTAGHVDTLRSEGIAVEEINTVSQLRWKLRTDWNFANDYYFFLQQQNYGFFHNQYFYNRLNRFSWNSPHDYWMNWQWNWHYGYSNNWMWNQYPYYGNWGSSQWYWNQWNNPWQYSHVYGPRTQWLGNVYGRRGSNNWGNRISNQTTIANKIVTNRERPRVNVISNKPVIVNQRPNNNWNTNIKPNSNNRPINNNIIIKPNNSRPVYNNNNKPVYNNNSRPSNNWSKPSNTSRPSNNTRSISTPKKRGGQ